MIFKIFRKLSQPYKFKNFLFAFLKLLVLKILTETLLRIPFLRLVDVR